jgi:hypothetical protein
MKRVFIVDDASPLAPTLERVLGTSWCMPPDRGDHGTAKRRTADGSTGHHLPPNHAESLLYLIRWADAHARDAQVVVITPRNMSADTSATTLDVLLAELNEGAAGGAQTRVSTGEPRHPGLLPPDAGTPRMEAAARWTDLVMAVVTAPHDPKTLQQWARHVIMSTSTLKTRCYTAGIRPRRSLLFARLWRASHLRERCEYPLEASLDVADLRTLAAMFRYSGLADSADRVRCAPTVEEFFARQTLVTDPHLLLEVGRRRHQSTFAAGDLAGCTTPPNG